MTLGMDLGEVLHPVEVDLLCAFAEVVAPYPLEVPSTGLDEVERLVMFQGAKDLMAERGLADDGGPLGVADDFVYLLQNATGVLDLLLMTDKPVFAAVALTYRTEALLVTQELDDPDRMIRMKACTLDEAVDLLAGMIPTHDAPVSAPFSLPRKAIEGVFREIRKRMPEEPDLTEDPDDVNTTAEIRPPKPMRSEELDELLRQHGIDDSVARRMSANLQPVFGSGQTGVAKRDDSEDQWRRAGAELRWVDTQRGRFRIAEDGDWVSVNPLAQDEVRATLRRMASTIRG